MGALYFSNFILHIMKRLFYFMKWVVFSLFSGIVVGSVSTLFHYCMSYATDARAACPRLIFLLPFAGLLIVGLYRLSHIEKDPGTNIVISAIQSEGHIPLKRAPLIFISTVVTHLFGGSAGREGAALQLGGSIGASIGKLFRLDDKDQNIIIMCGMSAAFSALLGTPVAAAIFSMEVVSVGIMYYSALVPCVVSSLTAYGVASYFHVAPERFPILFIPKFTFATGACVAILAILCAGISTLFCLTLEKSESLYKKYFPNPFVRIFFGGTILLILTLIVGNQDYNGAGMPVIERCFISAKTVPYAFLLKILFTAVTLGAGYKGGEIVPSLFIGATFGCLFGNVVGFAPKICAASGMAAVFCGVTNCPISSLLVSLELFGVGGVPYYLLAVSIGYMLSGYYSLYSSQKIMYSKFKAEFINRKTH